jgi:hypothetical protein
MIHYKQNGSTHIVIVLLLVIALIGTLGLVYWRSNLNQKEVTHDNAPHTQTPIVETPATLSSLSFNPTFGVDVSFSYPQQWNAMRSVDGPIPVEELGEHTSETITVTSPSKNTSVTYTLTANGGIGGVCEEETHGTIASVAHSPLTGVSNTSITEYTSQSSEGYQYFSELTNTNGATNASVDTSVCILAFENFIQLDGTKGTQLLQARIHVSSLDTADGSPKDVASLATIQSIYADAEYIQAKAIITSTTQKK